MVKLKIIFYLCIKRMAFVYQTKSLLRTIANPLPPQAMTDLTYTPPFTISADTINLIAEISALLERHNIAAERNDGLKLRKANRIKTIHSSLAIEGNSLSENEVRDILNGKQIVAPIRQIQEVKNAIPAYAFIPD